MTPKTLTLVPARDLAFEAALESAFEAALKATMAATGGRPYRGRRGCRRPMGAVPSSELVPTWITLRMQGVTYREIGLRFGYSHERVRQLVGHAPFVALPPAGWARSCEVAAWLEANGPVCRRIVEARFGLADGELTRLAELNPDLPRHLVIQDGRDGVERFSDEEILDAIREVWTRPGLTLRTQLSAKVYSRHRLPGSPSSPLVYQRFGSWKRACALAGVPSGPGRPAETYLSRWDVDELLGAVRRYLRHADRSGSRPSYAGYETFQKSHPDLPSGSTLRNRLRHLGVEGWTAIVTASLTQRTAA